MYIPPLSDQPSPGGVPENNPKASLPGRDRCSEAYTTGRATRDADVVIRAHTQSTLELAEVRRTACP